MNTPTDTRDRILDAARHLFAEHGYDGTSIRDITVAAEANVAAVGYHFGSKEGLYGDVLQTLVGPLARRVEWACRAPRPPLDRIESVVRAIFDHVRGRPEMPRIMVREMASGREVNQRIITAFGRMAPALTGVIGEGQRDGTIREGDPVLLTLSVVAQPIYLLLARRIIARVAGLEMEDEATAARMTDHSVTIVRAALQRPQTPESAQ
jgi:AcrR family transcriptional regulator